MLNLGKIEHFSRWGLQENEERLQSLFQEFSLLGAESICGGKKENSIKTVKIG
jgi:hypothetical protein